MLNGLNSHYLVPGGTQIVEINKLNLLRDAEIPADRKIRNITDGADVNGRVDFYGTKTFNGCVSG
ncbi:MAG: hypothetical protein WC309_03565, partial [Candidatus Paceibacterota bacterium]